MKAAIEEVIGILEDELKWQKSLEADGYPELDETLSNIERCLELLRKE